MVVDLGNMVSNPLGLSVQQYVEYLAEEGKNGWEIAKKILERELSSKDIKEVTEALNRAGFPTEKTEGSIGVFHLIVEKNKTEGEVMKGQAMQKPFEVHEVLAL